MIIETHKRKKHESDDSDTNRKSKQNLSHILMLILSYRQFCLLCRKGET